MKIYCILSLTAKFKDKPTWTWKHANIACLGFGKGKHALKAKHITYKDPKVAILGL